MLRQGERMQHKYRPWCFALTCRETGASYSHMLSSLRESMNDMLDFDFDFDCCIIDHSQGAANAIRAFRSIGDEDKEVDEDRNRRVALCYPHIARQAIQGQLKKMKDVGFRVIAQEHMTILHMCRSEGQFDRVAERILKEWRHQGEEALANWLVATYLHPLFKYWFVTATGIHPC